MKTAGTASLRTHNCNVPVSELNVYPNLMLASHL